MPEVQLRLSEDGADLERIDDLSRGLLNDLRARELLVDHCSVDAPSGAKSGTALTLGALMVALANSSAAANFVTGIFDWLRQGRARSVKLTIDERSIELSSASAEQQQQLIKWLVEDIRTDPRKLD
jgi:hypothetical protein